MTVHRRPSRLAACVRGLAALVTLAAFVIGVPAALLALGADPRSVRLPSLSHLRDLLLRPDRDGTVLLALMRAVAWACWASFTLTVGAETFAAITGWAAPRLRALAAVQQPAALLVAAVAAAVSTPNPASAAAGLAGHTSAVAAADPAAANHPTGTASTRPQVVPAGPVPAAAPAPWRADGHLPDAGRLPHVSVGRYDSLWRIAQRHLGSGPRWAEIYQLNAGRVQPGGRALTDPDHIEEGWTLYLPPDATGATPPHGRSGEIVVVRAGDTLSQIAERELGSAAQYPRILDANLGHRQPDGRRLRDPDRIYPGWVLQIPPPAPAPTTPPSPPTSPPGRPSPPPTPTTPPTTPSPTPLPTPGTPPAPTPTKPTAGPPPPTSPSTPASPPPGAPAPTPTAPSSPTTRTQPTAASTSGTPAQPTSAHPSPATPPASSNVPPPEAGPDARRPQVGVDLPGGWIGIPLAMALLTAASTVWLRRRHRYAPGPFATAVADDPDLRPLPPAITAMRRAVREQPPAMPDPPPEPQPTVADYTAAADPPPLPPVGPNGADLAGLTAAPPAGGLGLRGPGAEPAARALLIAALSSGGVADPDARGEVVIPASTLTTLLGAEAVHIGPIPRLRITATLTEALTHLDELLLERRRLLDDHDATDLSDVRAADPYHPPMPPVLLISEAPPTGLQARLATTLQLGSPLQISAVLLGGLPDQAALTVHADGHTTGADQHPDRPANDAGGDDGRRLAVLDIPTAVQLLQVLREAHTGQTTPTTPGDTAAHPGTVGGADTATARPTADTSTVTSSATTSPAPVNDRETNPAARPTTGRPRVPIRLLGTPAILDRDGNPMAGLRHHAVELLVYLAVHRAGANLPDIMEAFWPNAVVRRASQRLSTEVANLRRGIRHAADNPTIQPVVNTGSRYHLDPDLLDIDTWTLTDALAEAAATTDPADRIAALRRAVDAHTGTLADGCDYDWIDQAREQHRRHGIRARLHLADLVAATDPHEAANLTHAAAALDPYNEELARHAMHAAARIGDTPAVRGHLNQLRAALDEIDEEPSPETLALAAQLLRQVPGPNGR